MNKWILLIDDDDQFRKMMRKLLERGGYTVKEAVDGKDGLAQFNSDGASLVITDLVMPNMEGIEMIRALRAADETVPIIAVSGGGIGGAAAYLTAARRLGAMHVFPKPFEREAFLGAVAEAMEAAAPSSGSCA